MERDPVTSDRAYKFLLDRHPLNARLTDYLIAETGLSEEQLAALQYSAWESGRGKVKIAQDLSEHLGGEQLALEVPGLICRLQNGKRYLTIAGDPGIAVPDRNAKGDIVALQIIPHGADAPWCGAWLSSTSRGGPSPGKPTHVSRPSDASRFCVDNEVWLTVGIVNADVACSQLGKVVLGVDPTGWRDTLMETLASLGDVSRVVVAQDAPREVSEHIASRGYPVHRARWEITELCLARILVTANSYEVRPFKVHGAGRRPPPRLVGKLTLPGPVSSLQDARKQLESRLEHHLNSGATNGILVVRGLPGLGKSTTLRTVAERYAPPASHAGAVNVNIIVPRHDLADGAGPGWNHIRGRSHETDELPSPCDFPREQMLLSHLRIPPKEGCTACNNQKCLYKSQFKDPRRLRLSPAPYLLYPETWGAPAALALDDVAIQDVVVEPLLICREDIESVLEWSKENAGRVLHDGILPGTEGLLRFLVEINKRLTDERRSLEGADYVHELLDAAPYPGFRRLLQLGRPYNSGIIEPPPFEDGRNIMDGLPPGQPKRFVEDLFRVLTEELDRYESGQPYNSRLRFFVERDFRGAPRWRIQISLRQVLPAPGIPLIILDSTTSVEQIQRFFPGGAIEEFSPVLQIPESVSIFQIATRGWGKSGGLVGRKEEAYMLLSAIVRRHLGRRVAIITHKGFTKEIKGMFPDIEVGHYFGVRGSNDFQDADVLICFGTPWPNSGSLVSQARALYWDDALLDEAEYLRRAELTTRDGSVYEVFVRDFADPRLRDLMAGKREDELLQAVYRARPLDGGDKSIYIISTMPLRGLPVQLLTEAELLAG